MNEKVYTVLLTITEYEFGKTVSSQIKLITSDYDKAEDLVDKLHEKFRKEQMDEENHHANSREEHAQIITLELEKEY